MNLPAWTGTCAKLDESFNQKGKIFNYVKIENKTKLGESLNQKGKDPTL